MTQILKTSVKIEISEHTLQNIGAGLVLLARASKNGVVRKQFEAIFEGIPDGFADAQNLRDQMKLLEE